MALLAERLPEGVDASEYRVAYDHELSMPIIRIAMVMDWTERIERTERTCSAARAAAWETLAPAGYIPDLIWRSEAEQAEARTECKWERVNG